MSRSNPQFLLFLFNFRFDIWFHSIIIQLNASPHFNVYCYNVYNVIISGVGRCCLVKVKDNIHNVYVHIQQTWRRHLQTTHYSTLIVESICSVSRYQIFIIMHTVLKQRIKLSPFTHITPTVQSLTIKLKVILQYFDNPLPFKVSSWI